MRRGKRLALASPLMLFLGCGEAAAPPQEGQDEVVVAVEDLSIGALEDGPEAFGRITGLLQDTDGRILVADHQSSDVRVFAPDGSYLFSFGGRGEGPGELSGPCCLARSPDGLVWVRETENMRYSGFELGDSSAIYKATMPMSHTDGSYAAQLTFTSDGALVDVGHSMAEGVQELVRFVRGSDGSLVHADTLPRASVEDLGGFTVTRPGVRMFFYQPHAPRELIAHGPGGLWAHGLSSTYEITLHDGDESRLLVGTAARPPISSRERRAAEERMQADAERAGMTVRQLPYGIPDSKPPLQAIFFDEAGELWVELSREDGAPRTADVWSRKGELIRRVQWPAEVAIANSGWIGRNSALGVRRDSLGVEHVARLKF